LPSQKPTVAEASGSWRSSITPSSSRVSERIAQSVSAALDAASEA
jgi:hypothetical protein